MRGWPLKAPVLRASARATAEAAMDSITHLFIGDLLGLEEMEGDESASAPTDLGSRQ
jgi:hypothetical protein